MNTNERRRLAKALLNAPSHKDEREAAESARTVDILPAVPVGAYQLVPARHNWDSEDTSDFLAAARQAGAAWDTWGHECLISGDRIPAAVEQLLVAGFVPAIGFLSRMPNDHVLDDVETLFEQFRREGKEPASLSQADETPEAR